MEGEEGIVIRLTTAQRLALFEDNEKLAEWATSHYFKLFGHQSRLSADEFRQAARIGLMKASRNWDPNRGTAFSAYAEAAMRNEIQRTDQLEGSIEIRDDDNNVVRLAFRDIDELATVMPDTNILGPEQELLSAEQEKMLLDMINASGARKRAWRGHVWNPSEVAERLMQGDTQASIAAALGVSRQRIGQIVDSIRRRMQTDVE